MKSTSLPDTQKPSSTGVSARERALHEILNVISKSRGDGKPVFDAIIENASKLCHAPHAVLWLLNDAGTELRVAAQNFAASSMVEKARDTPFQILDADRSVTLRAMNAGEVTQYVDLSKVDDPELQTPQLDIAVNVEGIRTLLLVPLISKSEGIGVIILYKQEVAPFDDSEIALASAFATQAVIAIENTRQFQEIETRLMREAASREILDVISRNQEDEEPVFEAVLRFAATLCAAPMGSLNIVEEGRKRGRLVSHWGDNLRLIEVGKTLWDLDYEDGTELFTEVSMREGIIRHCVDLKDTSSYRAGAQGRCDMVDVEGIRTFLAVPLIRQGVAIGNIALYRREVLPFTPDQIALVETFAAQAVIAIENVRQFKALEALNGELEDRVEAQVGEIERMGKLKRFLPAAVADTVVSSGSESMLKSHRALLGVLFCDIRGFTAFCETAEPEETIEVLQTYHEEMGKLIDAHGAGVDHRMGDGIMVLFNDPLPCDDPAGEAVRLALDMRARMAELSKQWKRLGYRLGFGVGVSLGYATVGMVGYEGRFDYTASGTAVNLAARLCDEAEDGEILLSPRAAIAIEDDLSVEARGELVLKGIREPVETFRLSDVCFT